MDRHTSRETSATSAHIYASNSGGESTDPSRPSASNVLSQMEEESAQLSSLVHQESLRRSSLPPHMVALPPSLPVSPTSPRTYGAGSSDWPISRAASLARARSLAIKRTSGDQTNSVSRQSSIIARRRVQSEDQTSPTIDEMRRSGSAELDLPRSESPSPIPRRSNSDNVARTDRPILSVSTGSTASSPQKSCMKG